MAEGSKTEGGGEQANTRWWESYLVRYFLGFIVGVVCLGILAADSGLLDKVALFAPDKDGKRDWTLVAICGVLFGLGYCYIASTPITVLHYGRYGSGFVESSSRNFWLGWVLLLLLFLCGLFPSGLRSPTVGILETVVATVLILLLPPRDVESKSRRNKSQHKIKAAITLLPLNSWKKLFQWLGVKWKSSVDGIRRFRRLLSGWPILLILLQASLWCFVMGSCLTMIWGCYAPGEPKHVRGLWLFSLPVVWIGLAQYAVLVRVLTSKDKAHEFFMNLAVARQKKVRAKYVTRTHIFGSTLIRYSSW